MLKFNLCFVVFMSFCSCNAKSIPKYIKPCSISDPKFEECAIKNGHDAIPFIIKGDREYSIPNFEPLKIDKLHFSAGNLEVDFKNMEITGLEKTEVIGVKVDTDKQAMYISIKTPKLEVVSPYKAKGQILIVPIEGNGISHMTLINGVFNCSMLFDNFRPGSTKPIIFKNSVVTYTAEDSKYNFENLFNGNKQLGDEVNKVLNENHASLYRDFGPVVAETVNTVLKAIVTGIIQDLYFKDAFNE